MNNPLQIKPSRFNSKSAPQLPPIGANKPADNVNLNKVVVINKNDLERITGHLNRRQKEKEAVLEDLNRRKELHEKSLALTRSWNNTIDGARRRKLEQKKVREEKEEEERKKVDLEHEKYMVEERKKALEQAKLLQYYETDKIKTFHSALKLTEVVKEREAQIELKKMLEQMNRQREEDEYKQNIALLNEQYKEELELDKKRQKEKLKLTEYHRAQIKAHTEQNNQAKNEYLQEGEMLRKLNEQFAYEREQLEQIQAIKAKELKQTYDKAIENRAKMFEAEKIMDEEENEEIRIYASAKRKMIKMRREKEIEIWREKQEQREKMIAHLGSLLKTQEADEDFRIAKAVQEREKKLAEEEREKMEKLKQMQDSITKYRKDTIENKKIQKEMQEKENGEYMKSKMESDKLYQVYEEEKARQRHKKSEIIAKKNLNQAKERQIAEKNIRLGEKDFVKNEQKLIDLEDKQFEDYANRVIDYMGDHGRNTYPMKKVLNNHLMSTNKGSEQKSEAALIKKHQNEVPTNKNLGFTHN